MLWSKISPSRCLFINIGGITLKSKFIMKKITLLMIALLTISVTMAQTTYFPVYDGTFGNATYSQDFNFPT